MREDDPFEDWLFVVEMSRTDPLPDRAGRDLGTALRRLAELLAAAPPGKVDYNKVPGGVLSIYTTYGKVAPTEAAEAQRLFHEVWERGGPGQRHVQLALLKAIALYAHHTLDDLHEAIQDAFKWDNDHLYAFYMNGERYDERYEVTGPHLDSETDLLAWELTLAALGLVPEHTFLYFFDFGDSHEFLVKVLHVAIEPGVTTNSAPRLVAAKGAAPRQYHWDEDEDEDEDEM